ncbi:nitrite reductase small subunit NirD [Shewanella submarina]|uniref:Nitrite reductase small subunit NirD n=1 Tax=Shewanella submarina TaxID=2016376 RepID=A0ABV7GJS4_9GAMM|nr:nitrite reductase small subunit NirD [Shewanella submarina]MCL1035961.1 nitrite reductase small subunit NirD [Shewanella submarina]
MNISGAQWHTICQAQELIGNTGVCALFNNTQVAIFLCGASGKLYAVDNFDPIGKANVLSRGIMGSVGDRPTVASPLYKQRFCLESGECLDDDQWHIKTYPVRCYQGDIQLGVP